MKLLITALFLKLKSNLLNGPTLISNIVAKSFSYIAISGMEKTVYYI